MFLRLSVEPHLEKLLFCACEGNHDLWVRTPQDSARFPDSICKMLALWALCDELDVDIAPAEVTHGVWVVPLFSWYAHTFDVRDPRRVMSQQSQLKVDEPDEMYRAGQEHSQDGPVILATGIPHCPVSGAFI